ncbi:MAG: hypothetical protein AAF557_16300 [Pseudomonadota bacterium]
MLKRILATTATVATLALMGGSAQSAEGQQIKVIGEVIDTWCYFSGVMGGPEAVTGSAHHTCAMWCAAGGIPVGILAEDGTVYMVIKWEGNGDVAGKNLLKVQAHEVEAEGILHERDGINYLIVEKVINDNGIVNLNHDEWGVVPGFAIPKSVTGG